MNGKMNSSPKLIDTQTAVVFILKMRKLESNESSRLAARKHIYYLARIGKLTRYGNSVSGQVRWDLLELAEPYRKSL